MTDHTPPQPRSPWRPALDAPREPRIETYRASGAWGRVVEVTRDVDTGESRYRQIRAGDPPPKQDKPEPGTPGERDHYARSSLMAY